MKDSLFSESINAHTLATQHSLREAIANVPCAEVEALSVDLVFEHLARAAVLLQPVFDPEPLHKDLDDGGDTASYFHRMSNGNALRFTSQRCAKGINRFSTAL